jgi:hypothetical protein
MTDWLTTNNAWIGGIGTLASLFGLLFSWLAWQNAEGAKAAANEAKSLVQRRERATLLRDNLDDITRDIDWHVQDTLDRRSELLRFSARLKDRIIRCSKAAKSDYAGLSARLLMVGTRLEPLNLDPPNEAAERLRWENALLIEVRTDLNDIVGDLSYGDN